jgi:hypothetical protein
MSTTAPAKGVQRIEKQALPLHHCYLIDWNDDGILKEMAVVCEEPNGTIHAIDVAQLHNIDKARLKKVLVSVHADKYPLWELLSQARLPNGMNFLDFAHANLIKVKRPRGAVIGGSLLDVSIDGVTDKIIGSEFADPRGGTVSQEANTGALTGMMSA